MTGATVILNLTWGSVETSLDGIACHMLWLSPRGVDIPMHMTWNVVGSIVLVWAATWC